ncbi:hypothetical protein [Luethyella okanaganae]|uniref:Uncharacterized protein n=1 Tax=Luethyella okanaganae TaxID=69372 RepID=A0ABW1VAS5_9MICO
MRKFLFNGAVLGALGGAIGVIQATRKGPRDWRLLLMWIGWGLTLAVAIGTVIKESDERALESR